MTDKAINFLKFKEKICFLRDFGLIIKNILHIIYILYILWNLKI